MNTTPSVNHLLKYFLMFQPYFVSYLWKMSDKLSFKGMLMIKDALVLIWISEESFKQWYIILSALGKKEVMMWVSCGLDVWDITSAWIQTRTFCSEVKTWVRSLNMPKQNQWPYVMSWCNAFDTGNDAEGNDCSNKSKLNLIYWLNNII